VPAGTSAGQATFGGGASLGTLAQPANNSMPAKDKPQVAAVDRGRASNGDWGMDGFLKSA